MRFPIWPKLSLSNDGYKKAHRNQIGKIGVSHEKGGHSCGSSVPGTLSTFTHLIFVIFLQPSFSKLGENWSLICDTTAKSHFQ